MLKYARWIAVILFIGYISYYFFFKTMLVLGQPAPPFTATDINGQPISLDQFKGKYVLIDFWGSWCGPCRKENPILVMMYDRYHDKTFKQAGGIEFLSIALENNAESAKQAIKTDGLNWKNHIVEADALDSPIAKLYRVSSIPTKYLIGPDQIIQLTDPSIQELDDFLAYQILKN